MASTHLPNEDVEDWTGALTCPHCSTAILPGVWRCPTCHHQVRFSGDEQIQESESDWIFGGLEVIEFLVLLTIFLVMVLSWVTSSQNPLGERLLVVGSLLAPVLYGIYLARK